MVTRKETRIDPRVGVITTIQVTRETRKAIMHLKPSDMTYDDFFKDVFKL